jgi:transcriptional regulator with XRE-family HTH domain
MDRTTIAKLEKGQRQVRLEELVAIAAAIDVSPLALFLPLRLEEPVRLTPKLERESFAVLQWARGDGPLDKRNERTYHFQSIGSQWVVWTPGDPYSIEHGGALTHEESEDLVSESEQSAKRAKRVSGDA